MSLEATMALKSDFISAAVTGEGKIFHYMFFLIVSLLQGQPKFELQFDRMIHIPSFHTYSLHFVALKNSKIKLLSTINFP